MRPKFNRWNVGRLAGTGSGVLWVGAAMAMLLLALGSGLSEQGRARIALLLDGKTAPAQEDRFALLSAELDQVRTELRLLSAENHASTDDLGEPDEASEPESASSSGSVSIDIAALPLDSTPSSSHDLTDGDVLAMLSEKLPASHSAIAPPSVSSAPAAIAGRLEPGVQFALELGVSDSAEGARVLWQQLSEQASDVLGDLSPMVATAPGPGGSTRHRLLAGPFANAATALNACVLLTLRDITCEPAAHEGQALVAR